MAVLLVTFVCVLFPLGWVSRILRRLIRPRPHPQVSASTRLLVPDLPYRPSLRMGPKAGRDHGSRPPRTASPGPTPLGSVVDGNGK